MKYVYLLKPAQKPSKWLTAMVLLGILAMGLLIYDVAQFKSLMLYVFTGIK